MSEGTTNSIDSREEMKVKEEKQEKIEKKMRDSEYKVTTNYMEAIFLSELIRHFHDQKSEDYFNSLEAKAELESVKKNTSGSNNNSSGGGIETKAGDYTVSGANGKVSFVKMIPEIAKGPEAKLKGRDNKKTQTANKATRKTTGQKPAKPTTERHDDRV